MSVLEDLFEPGEYDRLREANTYELMAEIIRLRSDNVMLKGAEEVAKDACAILRRDLGIHQSHSIHGTVYPNVCRVCGHGWDAGGALGVDAGPCPSCGEGGPEEPDEVETVERAAIRVHGVVWDLPRPARHFILHRAWGLAHWDPERKEERRMPEHEQGFTTSTGRFVDRQEALAIARAAGQQWKRYPLDQLSMLTSEDLW